MIDVTIIEYALGAPRVHKYGTTNGKIIDGMYVNVITDTGPTLYVANIVFPVADEAAVMEVLNKQYREKKDFEKEQWAELTDMVQKYGIKNNQVSLDTATKILNGEI